jgi:hypothetical protein
MGEGLVMNFSDQLIEVMVSGFYAEVWFFPNERITIHPC